MTGEMLTVAALAFLAGVGSGVGFGAAAGLLFALWRPPAQLRQAARVDGKT